MASDKRRQRGRNVGTGGRRRVAWSLSGEKLARRVPRFAKFVDAPVGGDGELTRDQREFLDKFSTGMSETMAEKGGESEHRADVDDDKA